MADLLADIQRDLKARLEELRPLAQEAQDLQRALDALSGQGSTPSRTRRARAQTNGQTRKRRPRGETRRIVLEFIAAHPGSTAGDLAKGLDMKRTSASTLLSNLSAAREVVKVERGYAVPDAADAASG